jgi:hypothetical protein
MPTPDCTLLIDRIEDFHEVWSDGFTGDPATVAKQLAAYDIGSLQTAKRTMKAPTLLREAASRIQAIAEAAEFENCGLRVRIEHVGKSRLDAIGDSIIINTLTLQRSVPLAAVYTDHNAKLIFHMTNNAPTEIYIDTESEEGFCLYLACLRHLVRRNMIRELNARPEQTA